MTESERYNGWTNRETWALYLWLSNEEPTYNWMRDLARRYLPEEESELGVQEEDKIKDVIEDWYNDLLEMGGDNARNIASDIGSLWRVDWEEITRAIWDDYYG